MASIGQIFKGALGGGMAGGAIIGGPFGAAGGALIGGITSLFDTSPEEVAREREREFLSTAYGVRDSIGRARKRALGEATTRFSRMGSGLMKQATAGAAERAYGLGAPGKVESGVIAATAPVAQHVASGLGSTLMDINRTYDIQDAQVNSAILGFAGGFADRPGLPQISDYWQAAGPEILAYMKDQDYIKALKATAPKAGENLGTPVRNTSNLT